MPLDSTSAFGNKTLISLGAFVVVIAGMRAAESILVPFLLAIFLAIVSAPPMYWLQRKGMPNAIAMLLVATGIIGIAITLGVLVGTSVESFSQDLPFYQLRLHDQLTVWILWLEGRGLDLSATQILKYIDPGAAMRLVARMLNGLGNLLANSFLIFLTVIFILLEASNLPNKMHAILDEPHHSLAHFDKFAGDVKRYLAIKTSTSLLTGVAIALWLVFLGVDYPVLWGLLAFMLNYIPNIGSIIAAVPTVLLALIQLGAGSAGWVALGYLVVNNVVGNLIEPKFMGRGLGLSSLVVFISLVFWGWVFGPVGMFLSVPLTMTVKIALDSNEDTRWIAILLGPEITSEVTQNEVDEAQETAP